MDERISLSRWCPPWVKHQHVARYRWACRFARNAVVLDAACGTGYGSQMLQTDGHAASVKGVDLSEDAIREASALPPMEGVTWSRGDVTRLELPDDSFDLYVSFETVEHLPDDDAYVAEAARVLKPDGRFLCSTPNRRLFHPGASLETRPQNPFHTREYSREDFQALLSRHFGCIEWYGQTRFSGWYTSGLSQAGRHSRVLGFRTHQATKLVTLSLAGEATHAVHPLPESGTSEVLIACCSLPKTP